MDISKLQEGLLNWFWLTPVEAKRLSAIENVCMKLYDQYFPEKVKNAKYEVFFPLIKYGLIEFYADNYFALSPSSVIFNKNFVVSINVPDQILKEFQPLNHKAQLGIKCFHRSAEIFTVINDNEIPTSEYNLSKILKHIPILNSILNSWKDDVVGDISNFHWSGGSEVKKGVYKKTQESYSQRGVRLSEGTWKKIPSREDNIDGYNLAMLWQQIQNGDRLGIEYRPASNTMVVKNIFFPIVIERLLFFNTILHPINGVDAFSRQYTIGDREVGILNKFLSHKIETHE
jgi:hypothetical protein